ncbi:hypothetical protein K2173_002188 [Erythroxylum novogranatense]|uniref:Uncharacterized protein n=1 Tax=Erythroxylum novogranatense TaxID=1862640 RepID=A0AAV8S6P0_9ROSI|nr:hypothetical protein K2173_002188 [Erythroxylum novogranatense]
MVQLCKLYRLRRLPLVKLVDFEQDYFLLLLPAILLATIPFNIMSPQNTSNSRKSLENVRGIHVIPHSPFSLEEFTQQGDYGRTCKSSTDKANQWVLVQRVWQQRPGCLRPIKTCMHVGVASSLYHSSRGKLRKYLRWFDYTMIATATMCLSGALRNENPKLLMAASAALLPIQPLMVSAVHTGMMEVAFAKRALVEPELRVAHQVHKMSSMLGGVLFIADDMFPLLLSSMRVGIWLPLLVLVPATNFLSNPYNLDIRFNHAKTSRPRILLNQHTCVMSAILAWQGRPAISFVWLSNYSLDFLRFQLPSCIVYRVLIPSKLSR